MVVVMVMMQVVMVTATVAPPASAMIVDWGGMRLLACGKFVHRRPLFTNLPSRTASGVLLSGCFLSAAYRLLMLPSWSVTRNACCYVVTLSEFRAAKPA